MWLFTTHGFFSAVCARQGDGRHGGPPDPDRMMVRARVRAHLEALQARFPALLAGSEILESRHSDYRFRIFVEKSAWVEVVAALAAETDYDNFKSAVAEHQGPEGAAYEQALHHVWDVMYRLLR
jgi:hypothetical protein